MFGKDSKKKEIIRNLDRIYEKIQHQHNISPGDFPNIDKMRETLELVDFKTFKVLDKKLVEKADNMMSTDITQLMQMLPKEDVKFTQPENSVKGGAFEDESGPFGIGKAEGKNIFPLSYYFKVKISYPFLPRTIESLFYFISFIYIFLERKILGIFNSMI